MPKAGDSYITILQRAHLEWGAHRHTNTRDIIYGEGYLQIPVRVARRFDITNGNNSPVNFSYTCSSADGILSNAALIASGSSRAGDIYAKQFQGNGNLKIIGEWFAKINAQIGDKVEIKWSTPTHMVITKL